jgi:hypothetical protein
VTWLYFGYLLVYGWLLVDGIRDDIRKGHPAWYVSAGVLGAMSILSLALAYKYAFLAALFGKGAVLLLTIALVSEALSGYTDLQNEPRPNGATPSAFLWVKVLGVAAVIAYSVPAYWMAIVVVGRAVWSGAA